MKEQVYVAWAVLAMEHGIGRRVRIVGAARSYDGAEAMLTAEKVKCAKLQSREEVYQGHPRKVVDSGITRMDVVA